MRLVTILISAILPNNSPRTHTYIKSPWFVACDFNHYTAILTLHLIILIAYSLKTFHGRMLVDLCVLSINKAIIHRKSFTIELKIVKTAKVFLPESFALYCTFILLSTSKLCHKHRLKSSKRNVCKKGHCHCTI